MNDKKSQPAIVTNEKQAPAASTASLVGDIKAEFFKITWTEPQELKTYTKVVVGTAFIFGMAIYFIDLALQYCLYTIEYLTKMISG